MSEIHSNHEEMFLFLSSTLITPNNQSNNKDLSLLFIYYKLLPSFDINLVLSCLTFYCSFSFVWECCYYYLVIMVTSASYRS